MKYPLYIVNNLFTFNNESMNKSIANDKFARIAKEAWVLLKRERVKQKKSIARILSDLVFNTYR